MQFSLFTLHVDHVMIHIPSISLPFHSQNLNFNSLHCLPYFPLKVNLLTPKSDVHLISPYIITPQSNIKVMRIKEMTAYLLNKLSLSATGRKERGSDN